MLLDLILLVIIGFLGCWIVKLKAEAKNIYKPRAYEKTSSAKNDNNQEFSLGMNALNSDFTGKILLDPLTNLPGREAFEDRLIQAVNQSQRFQKSFGVMFFDIDNFHLTNSEQSHEIGDKILIEVGKRLQGVIRQIDTLTRFAGDKFIVLLPQLTMPETAAYVAQRLIDTAVMPFTIDGKQISLTASVGVAIFPNDGQDAKTLLRNADDALHQAKISGKGKYRFYRQEMHALGQRELAMNTALSKPDYMQHLSIYFQPQIDTQNGETVCVQASPVLKLPDYPDITFLEFSKTAENTGRITEIGEWLLLNAILQFKKWHKEDVKPTHLAINVTYNQIQNPEFIYKITKILQENNVNPKEIIFEIVERDISSQTDSLEKSFAMLNNTDIQLGLSIFSLGRLALHRINKLPVRYLKIDAKLIKDKKDLDVNEGILRTLILLTEEIKINVIAEGIDSTYQKELLESIGCHIMQGTLFGEALPAEAAEK